MTHTPRWTTRISTRWPGHCLIRGYSHAGIIEQLSYAEALYLTLTGKLPTPAETRMLDALLNALTDHEFESVTVTAGRHVVSGNPQLVPGIAAALLAVGANTTSPADAADLINEAYARMQREGWSIEKTAEQVVDEYVKAKRRIPGLGHPTHKKGDYRAESLRRVADECGLLGEKTKLYIAIHDAFVRKTGKDTIPINVDGMMAAIMNEMGLAPIAMTGIAILSVMPGIIAHCIEEIQDWKGLRFVPDEDSKYIGEPERPLPVRTNGARANA
jgi:citrate synthase